MTNYFSYNSQPFCSITKIDYRIMNIYRCSRCNLRNPDFRHRSLILSDVEVITVSDNSPERLLPRVSILPANASISLKTSRDATHLAKMPSLVIGYAEEERQLANQCKINRKFKTGFKTSFVYIIHLAVELVCRNKKQDWTTCQNNYK
jgi:hypothetical protein